MPEQVFNSWFRARFLSLSIKTVIPFSCLATGESSSSGPRGDISSVVPSTAANPVHSEDHCKETLQESISENTSEGTVIFHVGNTVSWGHIKNSLLQLNGHFIPFWWQTWLRSMWLLSPSTRTLILQQDQQHYRYAQTLLLQNPVLPRL